MPTATVTCRFMHRPVIATPNCPLNTSKRNSAVYITEASQLRLPPGAWPATITVDLEGTSHYLIPATTERDGENEIVSRTYRALNGETPALVILND